jgi:hypothetical protein
MYGRQTRRNALFLKQAPHNSFFCFVSEVTQFRKQIIKEGKVKVEFGSLCIKMIRYLTTAIKQETLLVAK